MHLHRCPQLSPRPLRQSLLRPFHHRDTEGTKGTKTDYLQKATKLTKVKFASHCNGLVRLRPFVSFVTFCKKDFAFAKRCKPSGQLKRHFRLPLLWIRPHPWIS